MIGSGVYEVDLDGEIIGFEFGMLASSYTEEVSNLSIFEVFQKIGSGRGTKHLLNYFYGGARAYYEFREDERKVSVAIVSRWADKIGLQKMMEIYLKSIEAYLPKNGKAPKETGQEVA